ncbi:MAG: hypothetical protein WCJ51_04030 [Candidatus Moraniibacteriota bacterium]
MFESQKQKMILVFAVLVVFLTVCLVFFQKENGKNENQDTNIIQNNSAKIEQEKSAAKIKAEKAKEDELLAEKAGIVKKAELSCDYTVPDEVIERGNPEEIIQQSKLEKCETKEHPSQERKVTGKIASFNDDSINLALIENADTLKSRGINIEITSATHFFFNEQEVDKRNFLKKNAVVDVVLTQQEDNALKVIFNK